MAYEILSGVGLGFLPMAATTLTDAITGCFTADKHVRQAASISAGILFDTTMYALLETLGPFPFPFFNSCLKTIVITQSFYFSYQHLSRANPEFNILMGRLEKIAFLKGLIFNLSVEIIGTMGLRAMGIRTSSFWGGCVFSATSVVSKVGSLVYNSYNIFELPTTKPIKVN